MRTGAFLSAGIVGVIAIVLARFGMAGHMAGHMLLVAVVAPGLAWALHGSRGDPATRWPALANPLAMSLVELVAVWGWHVPAARAHAGALPVFVAEQASFLGAGLLLWSAALAPGMRAAGIGALLLTAVHMALLGTLFAVAPRPLYAGHAMHGGSALLDQQLGGVAMLAIGGVGYLAGALLLLAGLLREQPA